MTDTTENSVDPRTPIKLGNMVRSPVYGIEGIATAFFHSSPDRVYQIHIQPLSNDPSKVVEGAYIDNNLVDYVGPGFVDRMIPLAHNPYTFGDKVRDKVQGFEGEVVGWMEMMNGCIDIQIGSNKLNKDGEWINPLLIDMCRVEKTKPQTNEQITHEHEAGGNIKKTKKSLADKAIDLLTGQPTNTTDPAKRPVKTGAAMIRGNSMIGSR